MGIPTIERLPYISVYSSWQSVYLHTQLKPYTFAQCIAWSIEYEYPAANLFMRKLLSKIIMLRLLLFVTLYIDFLCRLVPISNNKNPITTIDFF